MGQRIGYYGNNFKKGLKDIVFENFSVFRQWYLDIEKTSREEFNEPFGNPELKNYLKQNPDFKTDFHKLDKRLIDELTSEFVEYCNYREDELLELFGPTMNKWRYEKSSEMVLETKDEDFIRLWNFIIKGRSLSDNADFDSFTNDGKIGFLTFDEQRVLKTKIETHFGAIEQIRQKYWTHDEKLKMQKAFNSRDDTYLRGHNPKSEGLEYVLLMFDEITANDIELITTID